MIKVKIKTGRQIFSMLNRLTKEYERCHKEKTFTHPDTIYLTGAMTVLTWVVSSVVDKELNDFIKMLHKPIDTETFKPIEDGSNSQSK